ncbi:unnamed protein product [Oncorhynchus mykiss]|uniref:PDZ domain-containing protein n=1 Tax=Oncorhynchus mykiss TaxID=8022 RepID=A0A060XE23_ONCMY|nr:unnamed protein product [Oncorhynchus mykiss]
MNVSGRDRQAGSISQPVEIRNQITSFLCIYSIQRNIVIGAIIENTPAERDGRLRPGDELISVDKMVVAGKPHRYVIDLMHAAAHNGQVSLKVRRRVHFFSEVLGVNGRSPGYVSTQHNSPLSDVASASCPVTPGNVPPPCTTSPLEGTVPLHTSDVIIHRKENEGFGFVIISSLNRPENTAVITVPHKIGRIIEGSPADRFGCLKVGDRILAVNGQSIISMPHADIVKLIKDAGLIVTLHIIPEEEKIRESVGRERRREGERAENREGGSQRI